MFWVGKKKLRNCLWNLRRTMESVLSIYFKHSRTKRSHSEFRIMPFSKRPSTMNRLTTVSARSSEVEILRMYAEIFINFIPVTLFILISASTQCWKKRQMQTNVPRRSKTWELPSCAYFMNYQTPKNTDNILPPCNRFGAKKQRTRWFELLYQVSLHTLYTSKPAMLIATFHKFGL